MSKKECIKWLDHLASVVVKTRDGFACQIRHGECNSILDKHHIISCSDYYLRWHAINLLTCCRSCHVWAHRNPKEFRDWFAYKYPHRFYFLNHPRTITLTWRKDDFEQWEKYLINWAKDLKVDELHINLKYRAKYKKLILTS